MAKDIFNQELKPGDYIVAGYTHKTSYLALYQIVKITPQGRLKVKSNGHYGRSLISSPQAEAIKLTKDQYEALVKDHT